jgi:hypothetical protein
MKLNASNATVSGELSARFGLRVRGGRRTIDQAIEREERGVMEEFRVPSRVAEATENPQFPRFLKFLGRYIIRRQSVRIEAPFAIARSPTRVAPCGVISCAAATATAGSPRAPPSRADLIPGDSPRSLLRRSAPRPARREPGPGYDTYHEVWNTGPRPSPAGPGLPSMPPNRGARRPRNGERSLRVQAASSPSGVALAWR